MGYTNRKYPVAEIAIATQNRLDHANERVQPGDIICQRKPHFVIGTKEASEYIWLRVEGLEENKFVQLKSRNFDMEADAEYGFELAGVRYDKRRYMIPLDRLKKIMPIFSISRARDRNDFYQPFINMDFASNGFYRYLAAVKPLSVHGLIFDKLKGEFL